MPTTVSRGNLEIRYSLFDIGNWFSSRCSKEQETSNIEHGISKAGLEDSAQPAFWSTSCVVVLLENPPIVAMYGPASTANPMIRPAKLVVVERNLFRSLSSGNGMNSVLRN